MGVYIRVNGRGNAWPLQLGASDQRQRSLIGNPDDYANASYSIIKSEGEPTSGNVEWEVLIDIGQGVIRFLIENGNRLPDAIVLSHSHPDHSFGLDWLASSYNRYSNGYIPPIYTTGPSWNDFTNRFPWLAGGFNAQTPSLGNTIALPFAPELSVTVFPVYHGDYAPGASMFLFEYQEEGRPKPRKAIFSGDLLCR